MILFPECDASKKISSFLGLCSVSSSQLKAESCKLLGKNSSIFGIWADWGLGLGKHLLQWFFRHFHGSICHKKCWSERMPRIAGTAACLCHSAQQCVVTDLLGCFVSPCTKTRDCGCQETIAVFEGKDFTQAPALFACGDLE